MDFDDKTPSAAGSQLLSALGNLSESISFCASGTCPLVLPGLTVDALPAANGAATTLAPAD